jgi:3-hydroxyisobutyrate dehydrogenase-like beta-hydroxyacid dehydrogenase
MVDGEFEFGFAVEWMRKDLKIAFQAAADNGASLKSTQLIDEFYAEIEALGGRRWDTSSLIARLEKPGTPQ